MDRGWAWVVMAACFLDLFVIGILVYSVGVIHVALLETYQEDRSKTAWVGAIHTSLVMIAGPMAGAVVERLGCRVAMFVGGLIVLLGCTLSAFVNSIDALMLTYGLIGGLGLSLAYLPSIVAVGFHFERYRGLASGLAQTGAALGLFAGGPLTRQLLDAYGLHGTFLMFGGLAVHACFFAMFLRPSSLERRLRRLQVEARRRQKLSQGAPSPWQQMQECVKAYVATLRNWSFLCYTLSILVYNVGWAAVVLHLPAYSQTLGAAPSEAAALFTGLGICSLVARLVPGMLATLPEEDRPKADPDLPPKQDDAQTSSTSRSFDALTMHVSALGLAGLATVLFPCYSRSYAGQLAFSCVFGLYASVPVGVYTPLTVELVGIHRLASAYGFETLMMGIGYGLGPPLAGLIVDKGGTYADSFIFSGGACLLACMVGMVTSLLGRRHKPETLSLASGEVTVEVRTVGSVGFLPLAGSAGFLSSTASLYVRPATPGESMHFLNKSSGGLEVGSMARSLSRSLSLRLDTSCLRVDGMTGSITLHGEPVLITNVEEVTDLLSPGVISPDDQAQRESG